MLRIIRGNNTQCGENGDSLALRQYTQLSRFFKGLGQVYNAVAVSELFTAILMSVTTFV